MKKLFLKGRLRPPRPRLIRRRASFCTPSGVHTVADPEMSGPALRRLIAKLEAKLAATVTPFDSTESQF